MKHPRAGTPANVEEVAAAPRQPRVAPVLRNEAQVTPLELFFDLVFVLAVTQCTSLMASRPTWQGLAQGLLVLAAMWWAWVGYAWLTSVINPEEGPVRIVMFVAMAAAVVAALCIPRVFEDSATVFAGAYAVVRFAQLALFAMVDPDDAQLRRSLVGLATGTTLGVGLIAAASAFDGTVQGLLWVAAVAIDYLGPLLGSAAGWRLEPAHFAERHGLIVLVALGESVAAVGVGAAGHVNAGVVAAAVAGVAVAAAQWWLYFDVVALVAAWRLAEEPAGLQRNTMARDSYSYLHLAMIAGIVLVALGAKKTLAHVGDELGTAPAVALYGGAVLYLLGHLAFRLRNIRTLSRQRLVVSVVLLALLPLAEHLPALAAIGILAGVLVALTAYEAIRFADARDRVRYQLGRES